MRISRSWWRVTRAFTVARPLGMYAIEWESTDFKDEVLGRLGGAFHGTMIDLPPERRVLPRRRLLAAARWRADRPDGARGALPPARQRPPTMLTVKQSGEGEGPRWERYFAIMSRGWEGALREMKAYIDRESQRTKASREARA